MAESLTYKPALPWLARPSDAAGGQCLSCVEDLDGGMVSGRLAHAQELMRMAITDTGTCITDPDYGYNVQQHLHGRLDAATLSEISARLIGQWRSDDRTLDAQCSVTYVGGVLVIAGVATDKTGPFPFTFSVSEAGAVLLKAVQ